VPERKRKMRLRGKKTTVIFRDPQKNKKQKRKKT
jgi:hypothetical protein